MKITPIDLDADRRDFPPILLPARRVAGGPSLQPVTRRRLKSTGKIMLGEPDPLPILHELAH